MEKQKSNVLVYSSNRLNPFPNPSYSYRMNGDYVTGISFVMDVTGNDEDWISANSTHARLVSLALYGAQGTLGDFLAFYDSVVQTASASPLKDVLLETNGIVMYSFIDCEGYTINSSILSPKDNCNEYYYRYEFSIEKK